MLNLSVEERGAAVASINSGHSGAKKHSHAKKLKYFQIPHPYHLPIVSHSSQTSFFKSFQRIVTNK